jgi:catechol 2,3-dioxygenase-like lactoylglutathione lyase family enzyme
LDGWPFDAAGRGRLTTVAIPLPDDLEGSSDMELYNVEGMMFPRPFRIRRFGHFGFNIPSLDDALDFYTRLLGFDMTDMLRVKTLAPPDADTSFIVDDRVPFLTHNSDHHSMIIAHPSFGPMVGNERAGPEITMSHFTWQVGSLEEVANATKYLAGKGIEINRTGRDMPGSNWHCYFQTPEGHTCELYYGMEQVGINGRSKPFGYYDRRFEAEFPMPQISDFDERDAKTSAGIAMEEGFERQTFGDDRRYDVAGTLLRRPFKVTSIGPVAIFVDDLEESIAYYRDLLGFKVTEIVSHQGHDFAFMRFGNEHHSLKLYPLAARSMLSLSEHSKTVGMGLRLGSYKQLRDAVAWLKAEGVDFIDQPAELSAGVDYCAYCLDPAGHCIQLFYAMEQLGWDGSRKPVEMRRETQLPWPETLDALEDSYADQNFMGPLG